jgi:uncharacterized OsmC-like protein
MEATTTNPATKKARSTVPLNGVDTPTLFATLDAVKAQPELAKFQFRATNRWQQGTHSKTRIHSFYGANGERAHVSEHVYDADHPQVLVGRDQAPTPVEFLLHALAACITAGIGNIAAARGVTLYEVESTVEGDIDLQGIFGQSREARNGYEQIRMSFKVKGDADAETLASLVEQSRSRSAVYDVLTNGVPVTITVDAA